MQKFEIKRTDNETLVFLGEHLGTARSNDCQTEDGSRGCELALYTTSDGGYVVSIEYFTTCPTERSMLQAELLDGPQDVEEMLLVFDPSDFIDRKTSRALPEGRRQKLRKALYRNYDDQVSQILEVLKEHCGDWQADSQSTAESPPAHRRGILSFLRMK